MPNFLKELKRRKVIRVAGVYAIVAWVIIQIGEATFEALRLPPWVLTFIIVLLFTGFPITIIIAWIFDKTPEGKIKIDEQDKDLRPFAKKKRTWFAAAGIAAGIILGVIISRLYVPDPIDKNEINDKSIAVLPFTTFSEESEENSFFADGMHDDILTQLSKIKDLKVISRTSVVQYKNTTKTMLQIAKELNVKHILEGSVRRAGNRIRIVSQLINAVNDEHIWSETYDRDYADIFAIQSDVAKKIAAALKATLTPEEIDYINEKPTENLKAWEFYTKANVLFDNLLWLGTIAQYDSIISLYEQAENLDRSFLQVYEKIAKTQALLYFNGQGQDPSPERLEFAKNALKKARRINPNHPDTHRAAGYVYYLGYKDYEQALREFNLALNGKPNDAELVASIGWVRRRQGHYNKALESLSSALNLSPRSVEFLRDKYVTLYFLRKWDDLPDILDRMISLHADIHTTLDFLAIKEYLRSGNINRFNNKTVEIENKFGLEKSRRLKIMNAYYNKNYKKMIDFLIHKPEEWTNSFYYLQKCKAYHGIGNKIELALYADSLKALNMDQLKLNPNNATSHYMLGFALAFSGDLTGASREAELGEKSLPLFKDAFHGSELLAAKMEILILAQENDAALEILEKLLSIPSNINYNRLEVDPIFDPLRDNPRFQKLVADK